MKFWNFWDKMGIIVMSAVTLLIFAILTPTILSVANIINLLAQTSMVAIAAAGMTFAITGGGFDLSIGSILAITTCILGKTIPVTGLWGALGIAIVVGAILGAINGLIITKFKIQTFVATLATMIIYRGLALIYTQGRDASLFSFLSIKVFSGGDLFFIPVPILMMAIVFSLCYILYKFTPFGLYVRSIGSNEVASRISGIKVDMTIIWIFVMTAVTTVLSGTILTSQLLTGNGRLGSTFALEVITATILGGTSLTGGRGNVWGTLMAAIMLAIIKNGLNLLGVPDFYQRLATGIILILALSISGIREMVRKEQVS
jgi:ribose transport system permease protein